MTLISCLVAALSRTLDRRAKFKNRDSDFESFRLAGALYLAMLFLAFINSMSVQKPVEFERTVSYRETAAGMYSNLPFGLAASTVEVPYILTQVRGKDAPLFTRISTSIWTVRSRFPHQCQHCHKGFAMI